MAIHFKLILILTLCTISATIGDLVWSIDCGSSSVSVGSNFIPWEGDGQFFQTGTSVQTVQSTNSISEVMDTLRVFNNARKKNCYNLKLTTIGDTQVLVRASFNYGNYDKKSSPPTFDLLFDGNFWTTVETSSTGVVYSEVVYVVKRDYLSVCLVQTKPNQIPFISALEVRSLESNMYSRVNSTVALFLRKRVAYGATSPIRFADDPYDRIWEPAKVEDGQAKVANDAILIVDNYADDPPQSVLQNAMTTSSISEPLILDMGFPSSPSHAYINWYFTEVTELDTTQKRSFAIFMNNKPVSGPILPPYEKVSELYDKYNVTSGDIFSLVATTDSDLPPIISAMEVFTISDVLTQGTNIDDIEGLISLATAFEVLTAWGGDPCLPARYSWEWVNCSTDDVPRITAINLSGFGLEGLIPDLSSMDGLETINFQKNNLVGPIPDFLGNLPSLKKLNVADNKLSGPIPSSISKNSKLDLDWTGNPSLCKSGCEVDETHVPTNPSSSNTPTYGTTRRSSKKSKTGLIVGITIPSFFVFWAILGLVLVLRKRKTAAVAAAMSGANINMPQGKPLGVMAGDIGGEVVMNEFTASVDPSDDQTSNQAHQHV